MCEIFMPQYVGEASFTDAYLEKVQKLSYNATQEDFASTLGTLRKSKNEEDAQQLRIKASADCFYFLLPPANREWVPSKADSDYKDVKNYIAYLHAQKAWEEERLTKQEKVERKRANFVAAKLSEYDGLQPGSVGKDLESRKCRLREELAYHTEQCEQLKKELKQLDEDVLVESSEEHSEMFAASRNMVCATSGNPAQEIIINEQDNLVTTETDVNEFFSDAMDEFCTAKLVIDDGFEQFKDLVQVTLDVVDEEFCTAKQVVDHGFKQVKEPVQVKELVLVPKSKATRKAAANKRRVIELLSVSIVEVPAAPNDDELHAACTNELPAAPTDDELPCTDKLPAARTDELPALEKKVRFVETASMPMQLRQRNK